MLSTSQMLKYTTHERQNVNVFGVLFFLLARVPKPTKPKTLCTCLPKHGYKCACAYQNMATSVRVPTKTWIQVPNVHENYTPKFLMIPQSGAINIPDNTTVHPLMYNTILILITKVSTICLLPVPCNIKRYCRVTWYPSNYNVL